MTEKNILEHIEKNMLAITTIMIFLAIVLKTFYELVTPDFASKAYFVLSVFIAINIINYGVLCIKRYKLDKRDKVIKIINYLLNWSFILAGVSIIGIVVTFASYNEGKTQSLVGDITGYGLGVVIFLIPIAIFFLLTIFASTKQKSNKK